MTCSSYWAQLIRTGILSRYPNVKIVQARAYGATRLVDIDGQTLEIPAVAPEGADPIKAMKKFLSKEYDPTDPPDTMILMFHPRGGFSYARKSPRVGEG